MNSIKVCEYSRSRSFHDDLILQDQASGERSQDQWSSGLLFVFMRKVGTGSTIQKKERSNNILTFTQYNKNRCSYVVF